MCEIRQLIAIVGLALAAPRAVAAQLQAALPGDSARSVVLHPVVRQHFVCHEHPAGQLTRVGDALATDCLIVAMIAGPGGHWPSFYHGDGTRNTDWYGWRQTILAPFDGIVDSVHVNATANVPGTLGQQRASILVFRRADGVRVLYAHVQEVAVSVGDTVRAGQPVARIGNNGPAFMPHVHVGAWRGTEPLQVRFDLVAMGQHSRAPDPLRAGGHLAPAP